MRDGISDRLCRASSPLAILPLPLVETVLALAVDGSLTKISTLAQVSREWFAYAQAVATARQLRTTIIKYDAVKKALSSRSALLDLRDDLTLRRARLRELHVGVSDFDVTSADVWSGVLAGVPHLETLVLHPTCILLGFAPVLRAAVRLFPRVRSLQIPGLPQHVYAYGANGPAAAEFSLSALIDACAHWKQNGGGLRELKVTIPFEQLEDHTAKATRFVEALTTYCPNIEVVGNEELMFAGARWYIAIDTWERFCVSCTHLREFDWRQVPFTTAFFEAFGRHCKPQLEMLAFEYAESPNGNVHDRRSASGSGDEAQKPEAVFAACPALRHLRIECDDVDRISHDDMFHKSLLSDAFYLTLAKCCPQLERLETAIDVGISMGTLSETAMRALATLPALTTVNIERVIISGEGLFALVADAVRRQWTRQRNYRITLGEDGETASELVFYDTALAFVRLLAQWGEDHDEEDIGRSLPCASERVLLRLINGNPDPMERSSHLEGFVQELAGLVDRVKRQHAQIRLRVVAMKSNVHGVDVDGGLAGVDCMQELDFYTTSAALPGGRGWKTSTDTHVDDVFVMRDYYRFGASDGDFFYDSDENASGDGSAGGDVEHGDEAMDA